MIHDEAIEACIAQEQSSLLSVKCLFVLYLTQTHEVETSQDF